MQHSSVCHMVIDHSIMGCVIDRAIDKEAHKKHINLLPQPVAPVICKHRPPAHPASCYQICPYHVNQLTQNSGLLSVH